MNIPADTRTGIPRSIPFRQFKAATNALGITARGVNKVTINVREVVVQRLVRDENSICHTIGNHIVTVIDTIPLEFDEDATVEPSTPSVPTPAAIRGVRVIDDEEGRRIFVEPDLQKLLVDHGWLPPVDGA